MAQQEYTQMISPSELQPAIEPATRTGSRIYRKVMACTALIAATIGGGDSKAGATDSDGFGRLSPGETVCIDVGHPGEFAITNATITEPIGAGYATVHKSSADWTKTSTNNYVNNETIPNLTITEVGGDGKSCITSLRSTQAIMDLSGFLSAMTPAGPDGSVRILDTREPTSPTGGAKAESGQSICIAVGHPGDYAVINSTIDQPDAAGFATVHNTSANWRANSNNNYVAGESIPNLTVTQVGADGQICVTPQQRTHEVLDLSGFINGSKVSPASPGGTFRLLDTRLASGQTGGQKLQAGQQLCMYVGHPGDFAIANATATEPNASGYATVFKSGANWSASSNVNYVANQTIPNLSITEIGPDGNLCVASMTTTHFLLDMSGFISKDIITPASPTGAVRKLDTRVYTPPPPPPSCDKAAWLERHTNSQTGASTYDFAVFDNSTKQVNTYPAPDMTSDMGMTHVEYDPASCANPQVVYDQPNGAATVLKRRDLTTGNVTTIAQPYTTEPVVDQPDPQNYPTATPRVYFRRRANGQKNVASTDMDLVSDTDVDDFSFSDSGIVFARVIEYSAVQDPSIGFEQFSKVDISNYQDVSRLHQFDYGTPVFKKTAGEQVQKIEVSPDGSRIFVLRNTGGGPAQLYEILRSTADPNLATYQPFSFQGSDTATIFDFRLAGPNTAIVYMFVPGSPMPKVNRVDLTTGAMTSASSADVSYAVL